MLGQPFTRARQGQPLGRLFKTVALTADNQYVIADDYGMLRLTSNNATAANRTFTIKDGYKEGQELLLWFDSSSGACQLADSGNVKLYTAWEPSQYDTLSLIWTGNEWLETARTDNNYALGTEVTLDTPTISNLGVQRFALGVYDFAVDTGAIGAYTISSSIPDNAIVTRVDYEVITTFTSATDAATVALSVNSANDIVSAVAISNGANPWDAGAPVATIIDGATANFVKLTAARQLTLTIATEAVTAGKLRMYAEYMLSE